jgi:hypothetical protein
MRKYVFILLAVICSWLAPGALADRLVSQEPRFIQRRMVVEREYVPYRYTDDDLRNYRTTRVRDVDIDDDDDDDYDWDDKGDDDDRVVIRRPHRVVRRLIIRD